MKGVSFLTDETHHRRYVQLDLDEVAHKGQAELENLIDNIMTEARKTEDQYIQDISKQIEEEGF
jgi:ribonucleotide reductase beta subunit family protein with ferritin-like domain